MNAKIDPRNNQLLRHVFDINSPQTNPETIDMGSVSPVIDMGQAGFNKFHDNAYMQYALTNVASAHYDSLYASSVIVKPGTSLTPSCIIVPPGYNARILSVCVDTQIDNLDYLAKFNGQRLKAKLRLSGTPGNGGNNCILSELYFGDQLRNNVSDYFQNMFLYKSELIQSGETLTIIIETNQSTYMVSELGGAWGTANPTGDGFGMPWDPNGEIGIPFYVYTRAIVFPQGVELPV